MGEEEESSILQQAVAAHERGSPYPFGRKWKRHQKRPQHAIFVHGLRSALWVDMQHGRWRIGARRRHQHLLANLRARRLQVRKSDNLMH